MLGNPLNIDRRTVRDYGAEWQRFDQSRVGAAEVARMFGEYFAASPWDTFPPRAEGFDAGCGSGRWATRRRGAVLVRGGTTGVS
jgi:hypothetical protein